jgi:hypothetical protein
MLLTVNYKVEYRPELKLYLFYLLANLKHNGMLWGGGGGEKRKERKKERKKKNWNDPYQRYGHVRRREEERLPKIIMERIPEGGIKRGRPRKTWMEGVQAATKTRHLETDQWLNRKEWCLGSIRRRQLLEDRKDR